MRNQIIVAVLAGQVLGLFGFVEPLYVAFVLAGPPILGAIAAARRIPLLPVMVLWFSAGMNMLWLDWVLWREDVAYHAVLSVVMALLAAAGWGLVALINRVRKPATAPTRRGDKIAL